MASSFELLSLFLRVFLYPAPYMPRLHPTTLILATGNLHKAQEIRGILSERFQYRTLNDFPGVPAVVEDAATFAGNAAKKAGQLAEWISGTVPSSGFAVPSSEFRVPSFVLADDSGLEVDALGGAPGVHSARFAALDQSAGGSATTGNSPDAANNSKLLRLLENVPVEKRSARFRCVLALTKVTSGSSLGTPHLFEGVCEGRISLSPSGQGGFGYDPLFVPLGYEQSFAELGEAVKNKISHRAKALEKLREWLHR